MASVAASIRDQGYYLVEIKEQREKISWLLTNWVNAKDLSLFCRQFAAMFEAGLTITVILTALIDQTENHCLKTALKNVYKRVQDGEALSACLASYPVTFSPMMCSLVEVGEVSGTLDRVMKQLADNFEQEYNLKRKIQTAFFYPTIILAVAMTAFLFVFTFVLPAVVELYRGIPNLMLPRYTILLMNAAEFITNYFFILCLALLLIGYMLFISRQDIVLRRQISNFLTKVPLIGTIVKKITLEQVSRILYLLLQGGIPLITALEITSNTVHSSVKIPLNQVVKEVKNGQSLAEALKKNNIFPPMMVNMIAAGEESGQLDSMLVKLAEFYRNDISASLGRLNIIIEPVLLVIVGILLAVIMLACIMPIFGLITNMNHLL